MSPPTASRALIDVSPTIVTATTASRSETPRLALGPDVRLDGRANVLPRVGMRHSTPRIHAYHPGYVAPANHDRVGERRARWTEDVLQPRLVAGQRLRESKIERAGGERTESVDARRVELVLERFWIDPQRGRRVEVDGGLARVVQQANHRVGGARRLFGAE